MTGPAPTWPATESEVQAAVVEKLRAAGWLVRVLSQDKSVRRQAAGLPDVLAFHGNCTLLIECKGPGGKLRESQQRFEASIRPHEGPNLRYVVIYDAMQIELSFRAPVIEANWDAAIHTCATCGAEMQQVRPGGWQCPRGCGEATGDR